MGYLTSGAIAGATGEYLKQSDEDREFKKQAIRDKRLSGLKKEEAKYGSDLAEAREDKQRKYDKENYSVGYGEDVYRDGEKVASGRDRPTAGSDRPKGNLITMISGDQRTYEELRKSYADIAFTKDDLGNPIRNPEIPEWDDWFNERVAPQHRVNLPKSEPMPEPEAEEEEEAWYKRLHSWVTGSEEEAAAEGKGERGGMLSEKPPETKKEPVKLKTPLTREAKNDPVQMYDELMAQLSGNDLVSEQDIIDTIRQHFGIRDWQPPADALM